MPYVGGIRQRLIYDSLYYLVRDGLSELGWLDSDRPHRPINVLHEPHDPREEIALNSVVVTDTASSDEDAELGSNFGEMETTYYVDVYAEERMLGKHLAYDIRDLLRGRFPDAGRTASVVDVYDYQLATPTHVFTCDIENVLVDPPINPEKSWQKNMFMIRFDVLDAYGGSDDD